MSENVKRKAKTWGPLLALLLVFACGGLAYAARMEEGYVLVRASTSDGATIMTSTRTTTGGDTTTPARRKDADGNPTVVVAPRCTAGGGTVCVSVLLFHRNSAGTETYITTAGIQTATFSRVCPDSSYQWELNEPLSFPTYGLARYEVIYESVSSGTAHDYNWTLGAASRSGQ